MVRDDNVVLSSGGFVFPVGAGERTVTALGVFIGASTGADFGRGTAAGVVGGGARTGLADVVSGIVFCGQESSKTLATPMDVDPGYCYRVIYS